MPAKNSLALRFLVFTLAFLSFACLLGQFFELWTMHLFGSWVLPPATALLVVIACLHRHQPIGAANPHTWIAQGAAGAVVAALFIEALLLLTPYPAFFGLRLDGRFIILTASAHLIFGIALGLWCRRIPFCPSIRR